MNKCECVGLRVNNDSVIEYCPVHGAAPAMLEALEAIQRAIEMGEIVFARKRQADSDPYHPASVLLSAAIAQARRE